MKMSEHEAIVCFSVCTQEGERLEVFMASNLHKTRERMHERGESKVQVFAKAARALHDFRMKKGRERGFED